MASNLGITYEEVRAYQAQYGFTTYAENSGGYTTGGIYIEWTREDGFTGMGWKTDSPNSPTYNKTKEDIQTEIDTNGNLNATFQEWTKNVLYQTRYEWIFANINDSCRYEITGS